MREMCCLFLALNQHPDFSLLVAANRDEYYRRPTRVAEFWEDAPHVLAGRDLEQGGTWLGVTRDGRFAAVTNFRDAAAGTAVGPSRGHLVRDFLLSTHEPGEYLAHVAARGAQYQGFSLVVGNANGIMYYSNRGDGPHRLKAGLYGLSNHLLDTAWPKIVQGKIMLGQLLNQPAGPSERDMMTLLAHSAVATDDQLPRTCLDLEQERTNSPIFVNGEVYGTRCSTTIRLTGAGMLEFSERTFSKPSNEHTTAQYSFELAAPLSQARGNSAARG